MLLTDMLWGEASLACLALRRDSGASSEGKLYCIKLPAALDKVTCKLNSKVCLSKTSICILTYGMKLLVETIFINDSVRTDNNRLFLGASDR